MNDQTLATGSAMMQGECEALEAASRKALAQRRASSEVLTYELDGWVVREHPGQRIERLAPIGQYSNQDFPYPGFTPPLR